jgi:hypothetical protein
MEVGIIGSNIDIEAILDVTKRPMEHDILKGVHGRPLYRMFTIILESRLKIPVP